MKNLPWMKPCVIMFGKSGEKTIKKRIKLLADLIFSF